MSNAKNHIALFMRHEVFQSQKIYKHAQEISINNQYHILITLKQNDSIATIKISYHLLIMLKRYNINQDTVSYEHGPRKCYC